MANSASARKRARTSERNRQQNMGLRSHLRTSIKNVVNAIEAGNKEEAQSVYTASVPVIDSFARKGIIHTNKAARHKKRLNARIRAM